MAMATAKAKAMAMAMTTAMVMAMARAKAMAKAMSEAMAKAMGIRLRMGTKTIKELYLVETSPPPPIVLATLRACSQAVLIFWSALDKYDTRTRLLIIVS